MNKADEEFIKQAFKSGKVEQKGVHLVETSVSAESCQQPLTAESIPCHRCGVPVKLSDIKYTVCGECSENW